MAENILGEVYLQAGDKAYTLKFTTNALVRLEAKIGKSVFGFSMRSEMSITMARAFFWAALLEYLPDVTEEQAGDIMDEVGRDDAMVKMLEALTAQKAKGGRPLRAVRTGSGTGPNS